MSWEIAPPSWEAAATLSAGLAAVASAVFVGLRQMKIADRQVLIQERLTAIEALKVRSELFERRMVVYRATMDWFAAVQIDGAVPRSFGTGEDGPSEEERNVARAFARAVHESRFLFRPKVHGELGNIRDHGRNVQRLGRKIDREYTRAERRGDDADVATLLKEKDDALDAITASVNRVDALFLPELHLGDLSLE